MIEWLIGGLIAAAVCSDDSKSESRKRRIAEEIAKENAQIRAQALEAARRQKSFEQNKAHAQRFINKYALNLSPQALKISPFANSALESERREEIAIEAYRSSAKFIEQSQQIEQTQARLEALAQLENKLTLL
ncbi:MAG: hypothetical protein ACRC9T_02225 [Vibrionaceae bacterium]